MDQQTIGFDAKVVERLRLIWTITALISAVLLLAIVDFALAGHRLQTTAGALGAAYLVGLTMLVFTTIQRRWGRVLFSVLLFPIPAALGYVLVWVGRYRGIDAVTVMLSVLLAIYSINILFALSPAMDSRRDIPGAGPKLFSKSSFAYIATLFCASCLSLFPIEAAWRGVADLSSNIGLRSGGPAFKVQRQVQEKATGCEHAISNTRCLQYSYASVGSLSVQSTNDYPVLLKEIIINEKDACSSKPDKVLTLGDAFSAPLGIVGLPGFCEPVRVRIVTDRGEVIYSFN